MKKFQYRLEPVLDYKTQVLDSLKAEHAAMAQKVSRKQDEIKTLNNRLYGYEENFNQVKQAGAAIEDFRLYDMCIGSMEQLIYQEERRLQDLKMAEHAKKQEVVTAKIDTSKFEKMKDRRKTEYRREESKAEERYMEEFLSSMSVRSSRRRAGMRSAGGSG